MDAVLFALYALSHCAGFAGFTLMIALRAYDTESSGRMLAYNLFLVSFFLYLVPSNAAFFANAFLEAGNVTGERWYFVADAVRTSVLLAAGSWFFWSLPTKTGSRATLAVLLSLSFVPLAGLAADAVLSTRADLSGGDGLALRTALMRTHVFLIAGLLAWAAAYLRKRRRFAVDAECGEMMDLTIVGNIAFIPVFVAVSFPNFGLDRTWLPLCAENAYYFVIHAANIVVLALRVYRPRGTESPLPDRVRAGSFPARAKLDRAAPFPEAAQRLVLSLSECERNIMELMSRGQANKQIAAALLISEHAVRNHIYRLFKRFNVRNRVELADLYRQMTVQPEATRE